MAADGLIDLDLVLFADTGDEPFWVYQSIGFVRSALQTRGIPLLETTIMCGYNRWQAAGWPMGPRGSMPLFVLMEDGGRPGRLRRQCTQELKINPNDKALKYWLSVKNTIPLPPGYSIRQALPWRDYPASSLRGWKLMEGENQADWSDIRLHVPEDVYIENLFGISEDEPLRAKERGPAWQKTRYPLIEKGMTRDDCVAWLKANGHPVPYKSACVQCPYRSDEAWLWMQENFPDEFADACRYDDWLRTPEAKERGAYSAVRGTMYIHRSCIPLRDVDFKALVAARKSKRSSSPFELELLETCAADGGFSCMS